MAKVEFIQTMSEGIMAGKKVFHVNNRNFFNVSMTFTPGLDMPRVRTAERNKVFKVPPGEVLQQVPGPGSIVSGRFHDTKYKGDCKDKLQRPGNLFHISLWTANQDTLEPEAEIKHGGVMKAEPVSMGADVRVSRDFTKAIFQFKIHILSSQIDQKCVYVKWESALPGGEKLLNPVFIGPFVVSSRLPTINTGSKKRARKVKEEPKDRDDDDDYVDKRMDEMLAKMETLSSSVEKLHARIEEMSNSNSNSNQSPPIFPFQPHPPQSSLYSSNMFYQGDQNELFSGFPSFSN